MLQKYDIFFYQLAHNLNRNLNLHIGKGGVQRAQKAETNGVGCPSDTKILLTVESKAIPILHSRR